LLKRTAVSEYSELKQHMPEEKKDWDKIINIAGYGQTIVTSADLMLGSDNWRLIILTPLKNLGHEIRSVQLRHIYSLVFVIVVIAAISI